MASATFISATSSAGSRLACSPTGPLKAAATPAITPPPSTSRRSTIRSSVDRRRASDPESFRVGAGLIDPPASILYVNLPGPPELRRLLAHPLAQGVGTGQVVAGGVVAHLLGQLHRAEFRPAHRAEVRHLGAV